MECIWHFSHFLGLNHQVSVMSGQGNVCYDEDPENEETSKMILPVARFSCIIAVVTFKDAVKSVTVP